MSPSRTQLTFAAPIVAAHRWLEGVEFPPERPLINVSQAAPAVPPPEPLRKALAEIVLNDPSAHLYGAVLGNDDLRSELAAQCSHHYGAEIAPAEVAITAGCNQAFAATIAAIAGEGDEVIVPTPWYFNHKMWLDMNGVSAVPLSTGDDLLPDPDRAAALITPRTRAIVLVTPNNPGGVEYPSDLVGRFHDLARDKGVRLIVDETYRDFDARDGAPHDLFTRPEWQSTLVHLYSFSKAYRLTGHRVGAIVTGAPLLAEVEKFLDTVTICPNQIGQKAALWGMQNLADWLAGERHEILDRRAAIEGGFDALREKGWKLKGLGAYFAYVEHPFDHPAGKVAERLVREAGILLLPGSMFMPEGDPDGQRHLRIAFANLDREGIGHLFDRLLQISL